MKKILAVLFSIVLVLSLFAGCGDKESGKSGNSTGSNNGSANSNDATGNGQTSSNTNPSGAVVVNANAAVTVSYDANGLVVSIEGANEHGNVVAGECENYLGKPCADVVCDVIAGSNLSGFLTEEVNYVMIKQVIGSTVPTANFLLGIEKDAEEAIKAADSQAVLVVLTLEDLDSQGYIKVEAAQKLMQAYISTNRTDFLCVGNETPLDGMYGFLFGIDDNNEKLIVDAITGDVFPGELEGVDYGDGEPENELITEPTEDILGDENEPQETEPVVTPDDTVAEPTEPTEATEPEAAA